MKQGKITEITKVNEWDWPHWKLYYIDMKLDNGETISLGKKKADAFKVWDVVCYEDYTDAKGRTKQREVKDEQPIKKSFNSDNNKGAVVWMALKIAFECYYDKKQENFNETVALAQRIVDVAMEMMGTTEEIKESAKDDALPF